MSDSEISVSALRLLEAPSPGFVRESGATLEEATLIRAVANAGATSGWHHHGNRDVLGYVVRGQARFEFGADGAQHVHVPEGSSFHVPAGLIHRDVNPADDSHEIVLVLVGDGPLVVPVDGPS